jgi:hypothetical protein
MSLVRAHGRLRPGPRWPVEPLLAYVRNNTTAYHAAGAMSGQDRERARRLGLTDEAADRAATRLGVHPLAVWPDWCDAARLPFYEDDPSCDRAWRWVDVVAEWRRVLAEPWTTT